ncbi:hypothetical protein ABRT01_05975 [Lentibacillus sp. L22]|uniref:hypothetical protein n=1 Tax=Lentibacillus TaxID=175304 RepID=UPI0022B16035|nr:hypothetical protein [Lentibacillus daqui]
MKKTAFLLMGIGVICIVYSGWTYFSATQSVHEYTPSHPANVQHTPKPDTINKVHSVKGAG